MLRCQFLNYVLKTLFFYLNSSKIKLFLQKNAKNFERSSPQPPFAFGGWRLRPQTQKLAPPLWRISGYAPGYILGEDLFLVFTWIRGKKSVPCFGENLFFALHLICSPEKNGGRGSSPSMLKIGQNWGKIANYPPQCSTKICTPARQPVLPVSDLHRWA